LVVVVPKDADERPGGMSCRRHDQPGHAESVSGAGRSLTAKRRPAEGDSAEGDNTEGKARTTDYEPAPDGDADGGVVIDTAVPYQHFPSGPQFGHDPDSQGSERQT